MTQAFKGLLIVSAGLLCITASSGIASAQLERNTIIVDSPCPGPNCPAEYEPHAQGLRIVYLNFDGVTLTASNTADDATTNRSAIVNSSTEVIPAFQANDLWSSGGLSRAQIISQTVNEMYALHNPYNVEFVTTRPTSGAYSMIVFGGSCQSTVGESGCAGIALGDCGDFMPSNITFVFPGSLRAADLAPTAAQEAAHAFGLGHTNDQTDVMYPQVQNFIPDHFGAGSIPDGSGCPQSATFQDSHGQMLAIIGPRGQDTLGPVVNITSPIPGAPVSEGTNVTASVTDQSAIASVEMQIDGVQLGTRTSPPYTFQIPGSIAAGERTIRIRGYDVSGNMGFDQVTVWMTDGSEQPCDIDTDCADGLECIDHICVPDNGIDGELGDLCTLDEDCFDGLCGSVGGETRCTQECNENAPCPNGFDCIANTACWPAEGDGGGGGGGICSASTPAGSSIPGLLLVFGAILFVRRRRRS